MPKKLLFVIDFDQTLTKLSSGAYPTSVVYEGNKIIIDPKVIRDSIQHAVLLEIIFNWMKNTKRGDICVASFHDGFPEAGLSGPDFISLYLKHGLPAVDLTGMPIISYRPREFHRLTFGKNTFIQSLIEEYNIRNSDDMIDSSNAEEMRQRVFLIDDNHINIQLALENLKISVIKVVNESTFHIKRMLQACGLPLEYLKEQLKLQETLLVQDKDEMFFIERLMAELEREAQFGAKTPYGKKPEERDGKRTKEFKEIKEHGEFKEHREHGELGEHVELKTAYDRNTKVPGSSLTYGDITDVYNALMPPVPSEPVIHWVPVVQWLPMVRCTPTGPLVPWGPPPRPMLPTVPIAPPIPMTPIAPMAPPVPMDVSPTPEDLVPFSKGCVFIQR